MFRFSFGFGLISLVLSISTSICSDTYFVVKAMKARKKNNQPKALMESNENGEGQDHNFFLLDSK